MNRVPASRGMLGCVSYGVNVQCDRARTYVERCARQTTDHRRERAKQQVLSVFVSTACIASTFRHHRSTISCLAYLSEQVELVDVVPVDDLSKDCHVQSLANFKDHEGAFDVRRVARLQLVRIPDGKRAHSSFRVVPIEYRIASNTNEVSESQHGQQYEHRKDTIRVSRRQRTKDCG